MVRCGFDWEKAWMTARPRASEVMKFGSPLSESICADGVGEAASRLTEAGAVGDCFSGDVRERARATGTFFTG
jgi:hypothetical protein